MSELSDRAPVRTAAIAGYGRFGRALADLLAGAGIAVRAWDPHGSVPDSIRADHPGVLVAGADVVILAVPVSATASALGTLRSHLTNSHLVVDVGSVKHGPVAAMSHVLGSEVPWVATHPLFGPSSIALGERPLRAVVCPNPVHPAAVERVAELYERMGCDVIRQDADEHDRAMARTHAIAFFVAKGLLDTGAGEDTTLSPPSFRAMAETINMVRTDAGHLFLAIEQENPYAADARQELLDALARLHHRLETWREPGDVDPPPEFAIPDLGAQAPELRAARELIDELDAQIVQLLARRAQLAARAGLIKIEHGRGVRDPARERALLDERARWAEELGLPSSEIADVFAAILRFSRTIQQL
jgi:prephenate dehydrogenase